MPYITNNKRDYKKEYQAFVLRKQNNKEYAEKHRKDGAARSKKSWHKNKTPEKLEQKREPINLEQMVDHCLYGIMR